MVHSVLKAGEPKLNAPEALQAEKDLGSSIRARFAARLTFYWLLIALFITVADVLFSLALSLKSATAADLDGIRFNLIVTTLALLLSTAIGFASPRWWRRLILLLAIAPIPVLLVTSHNLRAGSATIFLIAIASWLGKELVGLTIGKLGVLDRWVVGATLGLGCIAVYGFVAGMLGVLNSYVSWGALLLTTLILVAMARARLVQDARLLTAWLTRPIERRPLQFLLAGAALACLWLNLLGALAPEIRSDAIRQRLVAAAQFARNGNLEPVDPDIVVATAPSLGEITYAAVITLSSTQGAQILHFFAGLACAGAIFALGRRLGGPFAGGLAAFAFYSTVMTGYLSQTAYLDFFTTLFAVTAALILVLHHAPVWRTAVAAGICIGLGVVVKVHFGYVAVGLGVTAGFLSLRHRGFRYAITTVAILTATALLTSLPWFVRSYSLTGTIPGLSYGAISLTIDTNEQSSLLFDLKTFGYGRSLWDFLVLPFTTTLASRDFGGGQLDTSVLGGHIGYLLLALLPMLFIARKHWRNSAILAGAVVATILWFYTAQYLRYGLPILAILLAIGGAAYASVLRQVASKQQRTSANVLLCFLALAGVVIRMQLPDVAHRYTFGLQSADTFLDEQLIQEGAGSYAIARLLNADPSVTRVFAMYDGLRLYTHARISNPFTTGSDFAFESDDAVVLQRLRDGGYSHIMVDRRIWVGPTLGWDRMTIANEEFLRRHTTLVGGGDYSYLYRILSPEENGTQTAWAQGQEMLPNGNFEAEQGVLPTGWEATGTPRYDRTGRQSHEGQGAVRLTQQDMITTTVPVQSGVGYLIATASKGEIGYGFLQTHVEWRDSAGQPLGTGGEDTPVTPRHYQSFSTLVTAPPGAVTATISLQPTGTATWVDDVSLRTITPAGASPITPVTAATAR